MPTSTRLRSCRAGPLRGLRRVGDVHHAGLHHEPHRADPRGLGRIVRDPQVRAGVGRRVEPCADERLDRARRFGVERGRRLVEQQHVGVELQHAQQRGDLRFAAGQVARALVEKVGTPAGLRGERFGARAIERNVAIDRERVRIAQLRFDGAVHLRGALADIGNTAAVTRDRIAPDPFAAPQDVAAVEWVEQRERAQQHAFARPGRPGDSNSRSRREAEIGRGEQGLAAAGIAPRDARCIDEAGGAVMSQMKSVNGAETSPWRAS